MATISLFIIKGIQNKTALLEVRSNIAEALDEGSIALFMHTFCVTIDVIYYEILLMGLECYLGIKEKIMDYGKDLLYIIPLSLTIRLQ